MSGVPVTIAGLPAVVTPDAADLVAVWDTNTGLTTRMNLDQLRTLYAALVGNNTFAGNQLVDKANPAVTLSGSGLGVVSVSDMDNGTGSGGLISAGRNNNAGTPASGAFRVRDIGGVYRTLWCDGAGIWRTSTGLPTSSTDTTGVVVGAQSSSLDQKDVQGAPISGAEALELIVAAAQEAVQRFVYKGQSGVSQDFDPVSGEIIETEWTSPPPYGGEEFSGVIVDHAPRYGTDRDEAHPAGRSLNTINAIGDLMLAVAELAARMEALEAGAGA